MPVPTLQEEALTLVFVGSFNPAIFHPEWFGRMKLVAEQDAKDALPDLKFLSHEAADVTVAGIHLQCLPERLTLSTPNPARYEQLQELTVAMLEILPHTPFRACGINHSVHYSVHSENYWHAIGHALVPKEPIWKPLLPDPRTQSVSVKQKREGNFPGDINITVEPSSRHHPGIYVQSNWHFALTSEQQLAKSAQTVSEYLRSAWTAACSEARNVAEAIFKNVPDNG